MFSLIKSLRDKWHGLRVSLAFSNWFDLLIARGLHPRRRMVVYEWKSRYFLTCDTRRLDHHSPKEALAEGAYDLVIQRSRQAGRCTYVNVGANIGAFDVAVAAQAEVPRALSVEMNPRTYHRLCVNLEASDLTTVRTLNCGVASETGKHRTALTECSLADSLWDAPAGGVVTETVVIDLKTLGQCLDEAGFSTGNFDLLKLDCEGAEYGIVRQSDSELLRRFGHIVMELHPCPPGETAEALHAKLAEIGFQDRKLTGSPALAANLVYWERVGDAP